MASHISCVHWVARGVAAQNPTKYKLDAAELARASELIRAELDDETIARAAALEGAGNEEDEWVDEDGEHGSGVDETVHMDGDSDDDAMETDKPAAKSKDPNDLSEYNLDDYDNTPAAVSAGPFSNIRGLAFYADNKEDPYVTLNADEDEEEERAELEIQKNDNLILSARTEDDVSYLEVHVYDDADEDLYVHHDIMLPAVPLTVEWLDFPPVSASSTAANASTTGNYVAIGTMDPEIEIWSLDTLDAACPDAILGRADPSGKPAVPLGTGKKKKKKLRSQPARHVDAVLSLSWNRSHRNLIASGSADRTVKLWDLNKPDEALRSFDVHTDTVQTVAWNVHAPTVLLSGSYDRTVRTFDSRAPDQGVGVRVGADVEAVKWDPWAEGVLYVSLDNGLVLSFDARTLPSGATPSPALWTLSAHDGAASTVDISPTLKGVIATGGADKMVKIWNVTDVDGKPHVAPVISRDLGVGKVFSAQWSPDDPLVLAAGGSKAKLQVWDVAANGGARKVFAGKLKEAGRELRERERSSGGVVGVASDGEDDEDDDDDE